MGNIIISYMPSKKASVIIQNKGSYLIRNIKIYDKNGVILNFDIEEIEDNISNIEIKGNIIYKIKENFSKKDNYIKKNKSGYYYSLYIYKENVDLVYSNLENHNGLIYREYFVNDIKIKHLENSLLDIKYYSNEKIKKEIEKLNSFYLPVKEEYLKGIFENITNYNNLIAKYNDFIKEYEPKEEDLKDNFKRIKKDIFLIEE